MAEKKEILEPGVEKFTDKNGRTYINRVPKKKLNPYVKAKLLATLTRDDINITFKPNWGSVRWNVTDSKGKVLFSYENSYDNGYYYIAAPNPKTQDMIIVAETYWFENDDHTNADQQDIFDILKAMDARKRELEAKSKDTDKKMEEARKKLTAEEILALQALGIKEQIQI